MKYVLKLLVFIKLAAFFGFVEIFLAKTPAFAWVYPWWGSFPVFLTVYIPFFLAAFYCYDWQPKKQITFIGTFAALDILMMVVFVGILGWI